MTVTRAQFAPRPQAPSLDVHAREVHNWATAPDPLPQYTLVTDALAVFGFAAYGGMSISSAQAFPDLGAAWQHLNVFDVLQVTGRGITFTVPASTFAVDFDGVYCFTLNGSFQHNSSNQGRTTNLRLWNVTTGAQVGLTFPLGIGRNVEDTVIPVMGLVEIPEAIKGNTLRVEIGNGSAVTSVQFSTLALSIFAVSEWREPLQGAAQAYP